MEKENRYVAALLNNDESIIREIYKLNFSKVSGFVKSNKGDNEDALDVFHDALLYIIVTQKEKEYTIRFFEAYLLTICKNIWKRTVKKRVMNSDLPTLVDDETDLGLFILEQQCHDLYIEKFQALSENCQSLLSEYFNGFSYENLMNSYGYTTINTVRQRIFKCRTKLISLIKKDTLYKKISKWDMI